jgi:hypothetical protein
VSEENKKVISANISTTTIKILGIPVYSIKTNIEVDEDALYQKMENRFNKKMTEAIKKAQGGS